MKNLPRLLVSILLCQTAGVIGSVFTFPSIPTWYVTLRKPDLSPPNWLFGPVWTVLFILMGIAFYLVWQKNKEAKNALSIFLIQLGLNTLWSILFFGAKRPLWALFEIIVLWFFILLTILKFYPLSKKAAWLLAPYLAWVSFAAYLNYQIVYLNR
jgi:tryptophan-rich sensory protein